MVSFRKSFEAFASSAANLQQHVMDSEADQIIHGLDYSEEQVRVSTVHARQDIVLLVSHLTGAAKSLKKLVIRANIIIILLAASFFF